MLSHFMMVGFKQEMTFSNFSEVPEMTGLVGHIIAMMSNTLKSVWDLLMLIFKAFFG
jgi:hypothetical protein